jgi:hypothetical protein
MDARLDNKSLILREINSKILKVFCISFFFCLFTLTKFYKLLFYCAYIITCRFYAL